MLSFGYTILYVNDVEQTILFYEKAFGFKRKFLTPGNEYGELDTGGTTLSFAANSLAKTNLKDGFIEADPGKKPFGMEIGFVTAEVQKAYDKALEAGASSAGEPKTKSWGQIVAYVRDINGFLVEICTPVG